jgi:hypothetical protein
MTRVFINTQPNLKKFKEILEIKNYNNQDYIFLINKFTNLEILVNDFNNINFFIGDHRFDISNIDKKFFNEKFFFLDSILNNKYNLRFKSLLDKCTKIKNLGRNGFSCEPIQRGVYHGCQSFYCILQVCTFLNPKEIICVGPNYSYSPNVFRDYKTNNQNLPDLFITETAICLKNFALPKLKDLNVKIFFLDSIFDLR